MALCILKLQLWFKKFLFRSYELLLKIYINWGTFKLKASNYIFFKKLDILNNSKKLINFIATHIVCIMFLFLIIIHFYIEEILIYIPIQLHFFIKATKPFIRKTIVDALPYYLMFAYIPKKLSSNQRKKVALNAYFYFKDELIENFLWMNDISLNHTKELRNPVKFRELFSEEKLDKIESSLSTKNFKRDWTIKASFLIESISSFTSCEHKNPQSYYILKNLIKNLYLYRELDLDDYDSQKTLMLFFAEIFLGKDWAKGFRNFDIIERSIKNYN